MLSFINAQPESVRGILQNPEYQMPNNYLLQPSSFTHVCLRLAFVNKGRFYITYDAVQQIKTNRYVSNILN